MQYRSCPCALMPASNVTSNASRTRNVDETLRQWQRYYRKAFPTFVFYFESIPGDVRQKCVRQIMGLGAVCATSRDSLYVLGSSLIDHSHLCREKKGFSRSQSPTLSQLAQCRLLLPTAQHIKMQLRTDRPVMMYFTEHAR